MEAWRIWISGFPCKISGRRIAWGVYSQKIYLKLFQRLSSANNTQIHYQFGIPSSFRSRCWILNGSAVLEYRWDAWTISVAVCDIREEKCWRRTDLKLVVMRRKWIYGSNKSLDSVCVVKRVITVVIRWDYLLVNTFPSDD